MFLFNVLRFYLNLLSSIVVDDLTDRGVPVEVLEVHLKSLSDALDLLQGFQSRFGARFFAVFFSFFPVDEESSQCCPAVCFAELPCLRALGTIPFARADNDLLLVPALVPVLSFASSFSAGRALLIAASALAFQSSHALWNVWAASMFFFLCQAVCTCFTVSSLIVLFLW